MKELVIIENPSARLNVRNSVIKHTVAISNKEIVPITNVPDTIPEDWHTIVVIGGDGSLQRLTQKFLKMKPTPQVIVVPGGSENGVYESLIHANTMITPDQLKAGGDQTCTKKFRPGICIDPRSGKEFNAFNLVAMVDPLGVKHANYNEKLRELFNLRAVRGKFAALAALGSEIQQFKRGVPFTQFVLTGPYLASFQVLQRDDFHSNNLTLVTLTPEDKIDLFCKLIQIGFYTMTKKYDAIARIVTIQSDSQFNLKIDKTLEGITLDDEKVILTDQRSLKLQRSTRPLYLTALDTKNYR